MKDNRQLLLNETAKQYLETGKSKSPLIFTKLLLHQTCWYSSQRILVWQRKLSKKEHSVLKLHAAPKLAKKYLDLLPTPTRQENEHHNIVLNEKFRRVSKNGITHSLNLADTVKVFLTPQASDGKRADMKPSSLAKRYLKHPNGNLAEQVAFLSFFPTPRANDGKVGDPGSKSSIHRAKRRYLDGVIQEQEQGKLNPVWVEWLMGYPINWTK